MSQKTYDAVGTVLEYALMGVSIYCAYVLVSGEKSIGDAVMYGLFSTTLIGSWIGSKFV